MVYVLSNRTAGGDFVENEKKVSELFPNTDIEFSMSVNIDDKRKYIARIGEGDTLVIIGGDGTLNKFVNAIDDKDYPFPIYCYAGGTGNDFIHDVAEERDSFVKINDYIKKLPSIKVNGESYKFVNGVGIGIDGYCCAKVNEIKARGERASYTKIALKALFGGYKRANAKITVDGVTEECRDVWLVSAMNGRYYGGGMMIAPEQKRISEDKTVTFAMLHTKSALRVLQIFPSVFKGKHTKYKNEVKLLSAKKIKVEFDRPAILQLDGETISGVSSYEVISG